MFWEFAVIPDIRAGLLADNGKISHKREGLLLRRSHSLLNFLKGCESVDKRQIIEIITSAAQIYNEQLCDKSLLLLYDNPIQPKGIEIVATPTNFLHLTGMIPRQGCSAESFYKKALSHTLSPNDFTVRNGASMQKMQVLLQTVNLSVNAKMIGDYSGSHIYIQTGKVTGSISSCLGLVPARNYYVPQTVLREDTRNNIIKSFKVLAILQKRIGGMGK